MAVSVWHIQIHGNTANCFVGFANTMAAWHKSKLYKNHMIHIISKRPLNKKSIVDWLWWVPRSSTSDMNQDIAGTSGNLHQQITMVTMMASNKPREFHHGFSHQHLTFPLRRLKEWNAFLHKYTNQGGAFPDWYITITVCATHLNPLIRDPRVYVLLCAVTCFV